MRAALIAVAALLVFSFSTSAAAMLSPLVVDWEQYFRVESQVKEEGSRTVVSGSVWNTSGWRARRIQLLIEGLDANGQVVNQRVAWLGDDLTAGSHSYFQLPAAERAASYRVRVFAFDSSRRK